MLTYLAVGEPGETHVQSALKHALNHHWGDSAYLSNFAFMIGLAAVVVLAICLLTNKKSLVPTGFFRNALEGMVLMIRGMVRNTMGHHGDRLIPFFCTLFIFILTMNVLGMIPIPGVGGTATSNLNVTGMLAGIVVLVSIASGFITQGPGGFLKLFVPGGLPVALVPVLFTLEFVGFFIKHGVLMVRLFANMLAGHLVIGAFLGLIGDVGTQMAILSVPLSLFVSLLEVLVAFLQAYVFTLLSVLFIGAMVHPDH